MMRFPNAQNSANQFFNAVEHRFIKFVTGNDNSARCIGVTAGASAPEILVQGVVARLQSLGGQEVRELHGEPEDMVFALPKELRFVLVQ